MFVFDSSCNRNITQCILEPWNELNTKIFHLQALIQLYFERIQNTLSDRYGEMMLFAMNG